MPNFNWEARTRTGGTQKGVIEAATVEVVEAQLKRYGFSNISIKAETKGISIKLPKFGGGKIDTKESGRFYPPVCDHDRLRPATGTMSGYPFEPAGKQGIQGYSPQGERKC